MSFQHVNLALLALGLLRIAVWVYIAVAGYQQRRVLPLIYGAVAAVTSTVFAVTNAHARVPGVLTDLSTIFALPIVVMIAASVRATRSVTPLQRRGWYL